MNLPLTIGSLFLSAILCSQCPTGNVFLTTQDEVNAFFENYPDCNRIEGDLNVSGGSIESLLPLLNIDSVMGDLEFSNLGFINNFQQFGNINYIGEDLNIFNCTFLSNLSGLESLTSVGGSMRISNNPSLNSLNGLGPISSLIDLRIFDNPDISQIDALSSLVSVNGIIDLIDNTFLQSLSGLNSLTEVASDFTIENTNVTAIELSSIAEVGGSMHINYNDALEGIFDLDQLISIGGKFEINQNPILVSLEGLDHSIGFADSVIISNNEMLSVCDHQAICESLVDVDMSISDNAVGCNNIDEVAAACLVDAIKNHESLIVTVYPNPSRDQVYLSLPSRSRFELLDTTSRIQLKGLTDGHILLPEELHGFFILLLVDLGVSIPIMVY